jgi:glycosyltransferase involved in cell wall biosynthesis
MGTGIEEFTLIVPYYRNVDMLKEQIRHWENYPVQVKIILVDDGSPEDAASIVLEHASPSLQQRLRVFRIEVDIPWNRGGARNLGAHIADTKWLVHVDIDHVLTAECAKELLKFDASVKEFYRFRRFRVGKADETRKKDFKHSKLPDDAEYGEIHPHVDSYLCTRRAFWEIGGYDEDYSGCLGGGNPFLAALEVLVKAQLAPPEVSLRVYTRSVMKDASDWALSRDPQEFSRRRQEKVRTKNIKPANPMRFPWSEILMRYPKVKDEFETLEMLKSGMSIARFGDGEMKLITGGAQIREPANLKLGRELKMVLNYPHPHCIVGIPTMNPKGPKYPNWRRHVNRIARLVNSEMTYYSAFISRPDSAPWIATRDYAATLVSLWMDKRVAFVCERDSKFYTLVTSTIREQANARWISCPHQETYAVSEKIVRQVVDFRPEVALLSCGPAATVMANKLAGLGIQALDLGSLGGFILKQLELGEDEELESES